MVTKSLLEPEREAVLDAASELFERYGYKKTTIDDIALEAGIGKGSVYLRFASKEEIGLAWLRRLHRDLFDDITRPGSDPRASRRIVGCLVNRVILRFDIFARHRRSLDEALCTLRPQLEEKKRAFHEEEARFLEALINQGVSAGELKSTDPLQDARTMVIATNSLLPYSYRPEQIGDRATVLDQATALAEMLVRALEARNV